MIVYVLRVDYELMLEAIFASKELAMAYLHANYPDAVEVSDRYINDQKSGKMWFDLYGRMEREPGGLIEPREVIDSMEKATAKP